MKDWTGRQGLAGGRGRWRVEATDEGWSLVHGTGPVVQVGWTMGFSRLLVCQKLL